MRTAVLLLSLLLVLEALLVLEGLSSQLSTAALLVLEGLATGPLSPGAEGALLVPERGTSHSPRARVLEGLSTPPGLGLFGHFNNARRGLISPSASVQLKP